MALKRHLEEEPATPSKRRNTTTTALTPSRVRTPSLKIRENQQVAHIKGAKHLFPANTGPRRVTAPDLNDDLDHIHVESEEERLRQAIEIFAEGTPRFLFRFWSEQSGGDARLNTIDRITPHAFFRKEGPKALHEMRLADIQHLAANHVITKPVQTVFSSWSQSLPFIISWAREKANWGFKNVHISVLDTTKVNPSNVILHTRELREMVHGQMRAFKWEYLVFGVIEGPAYRAIPYDVFEPLHYHYPSRKREGPLLKHISERSSVERKIVMINQIAQRYGPQLEVPVAAHLMAFIIGKGNESDSRQQYLTKMISTMPIPAEWATDASIMEPEVYHHGYIECYEADELLRQMVLMKHGQREILPGKAIAGPSTGAKSGVLPGLKPKPKSRKRQKPTTAEVQEATEAVTSSDRVPEPARKTYRSMVAGLFIDAHGYELSNTHINEYLNQRA